MALALGGPVAMIVHNMQYGDLQITNMHGRRVSLGVGQQLDVESESGSDNYR